ncbi:MAG TPA: IPT/TIG domain-containing protein [Anaeromyxobacter sp.]|nr:IPT/TIG domain-containing protein [Anaeromyxobacter sp.]
MHLASDTSCRYVTPLLAAALLASGCGGGGGGSSYSVDVSPASVSFTAEQYAPVPAAKLLQVSYRGDGLVVGYPQGTSVPGWLQVSLVQEGAGTATISVGVNTTQLAPNAYSATLRFITGDADGSDYVWRDVPVRFDVTPPAYTLTGTKSLVVTHAASAADLELPLTMKTGLGPVEGAACTWQLASSQTWLTVTPASGDLSADTPIVARLDAEALWALTNGYRTVTLSVQLGAGCSRAAYAPATMSVNLDLRPALSAAPVSFTVAAGSTAADFAKTVALASNLGEAFAAHAGWTASLSDTWATVAPTSGTGSGSIALELTSAALSNLPAGHHAATLAVVPTDARLAALSVPVSLDVLLPTVEHVSPSTTWVNRESKVIVRGGGFAGNATLPLRVGSQVVTATVVSDTELRATVAAEPAPGRLAVWTENALGIDRGGAELVVLPEPGYAATSLQLAKPFREMVLDPERQAVLLTDYAAHEVLRIRFQDGGWTTQSVPLANAVGAGVTVDGRTVLASTGLLDWSSPHTIVELDPETLAARATITFDGTYDMYSLVAPLDDGRTMLLDSNQWLSIRWYPGFAWGPQVYVSGTMMRHTRDRSRVLVRPSYLDPYSTSNKLQSFDSAAGVFTQRFKPAASYERSWDVSADGGRMLDGVDVYDREFVKLGSLVLPDGTPTCGAVSPDGSAVYTFGKPSTAWVLRRTDVSAAAGPYAGDAAPHAFVLPAAQNPLVTRVSEDGSTLFVVAYAVSGQVTTYFFHAVPLR